MTKMVFLSHIHEEKELAVLLKSALEHEFSGFVDVFVSSDGISIPAGANFLNRIDAALRGCSAAIYLLSPKSVSRSWINFELGAVWIRSSISQAAGGVEIPALPFCHSGIRPGNLPPPLNSLNGILAYEAARLKFAFTSLQSAVGGRGDLRTNFEDLAAKVRSFEAQYTIGSDLISMLATLNISTDDFARKLATQDPSTRLHADFGIIDMAKIEVIRRLLTGPLGSIINLEIEEAGMSFGSMGSRNDAKVKLNFVPQEVLSILSIT